MFFWPELERYMGAVSLNYLPATTVLLEHIGPRPPRTQRISAYSDPAVLKLERATGRSP